MLSYVLIHHLQSRNQFKQIQAVVLFWVHLVLLPLLIFTVLQYIATISSIKNLLSSKFHPVKFLFIELFICFIIHYSKKLLVFQYKTSKNVKSIAPLLCIRLSPKVTALEVLCFSQMTKRKQPTSSISLRMLPQNFWAGIWKTETK